MADSDKTEIYLYVYWDATQSNYGFTLSLDDIDDYFKKYIGKVKLETSND